MHSLKSLTVALTSFFHLASSVSIVDRQVLGSSYIPLTPTTASIGVLWSSNGPSTVSGCLNANGSVILTSDTTKNCPLFTAKLSADYTASNIWSSLGYPCTFGAAKTFYCDIGLETEKVNTLSNFTETPSSYTSLLSLTTNGSPVTYNSKFYISETFTTVQAWNSSAATISTDPGVLTVQPTVFLTWGA